LISSHEEKLEPSERDDLIALFNEAEGFYSQNNIPNSDSDDKLSKIFD